MFFTIEKSVNFLKKISFYQGDFEGHLAIWDLERLSHGPIYSIKAHEQIINTIDGVAGLGIGQGAPEIVTGSRDGFVKVWDTRLRDRPVACMQPKEGSKGEKFLIQFWLSYNLS